MRSITTGWLLVLAAAAGVGCSGTEATDDRLVDQSGALEMNVQVLGQPLSGSGYQLVVVVAGTFEMEGQPVPDEGGTITLTALPAGTHTVSLHLARECQVSTANPQEFTIEGGRTVRVEFVTFCRPKALGPGDTVFTRTDKSERYVLTPDGWFALQYLDSEKAVVFQFTGLYDAFDGAISFAFDAFEEWYAMGTLAGSCMTVQYNARMLDEFRNGVFCK